MEVETGKCSKWPSTEADVDVDAKVLQYWRGVKGKRSAQVVTGYEGLTNGSQVKPGPTVLPLRAGGKRPARR